jgi:hypothetical protein
MTICKPCGTTWTGLGIAHCGACHATFTTAKNFDKHRAGGKRGTGRYPDQCNDPSLAGLVLNDRGQWATSNPDGYVFGGAS